MAGCKPKDAEIQATLQSKEAIGINVSVLKGEVTLTGEVTSDSIRADAEKIAKAEKGVKSVINKLTILSLEKPVVIAEDPALIKNVSDVIKDFPTVKPTIKDGIITLNGEIQKTSLISLMQKLSALKPKKIENNLTVK